jgi:hypothetical protein
MESYLATLKVTELRQLVSKYNEEISAIPAPGVMTKEKLIGHIIKHAKDQDKLSKLAAKLFGKAVADKKAGVIKPGSDKLPPIPASANPEERAQIEKIRGRAERAIERAKAKAEPLDPKDSMPAADRIKRDKAIKEIKDTYIERVKNLMK